MSQLPSYYWSGTDSQWRHGILDLLWKQREDESPLCDLTISVEGQEVKAHWCVLMACPYFQSLYSSGMVEKTSGKVELNFSDLVSVKFVLRYIYTGRYEGLSSCAEAVLKLADYLQLENLKKTCASQLCEDGVNIDNCLHMCSLANLYNLEQLYKEAQKCLYASFIKVAQQPEIMTVPFDTLLSFVEDEMLSYYTPVRFFDLILRWVKHEPESRAVYLDQLVAALNMDFIKTSEMAKFKEESLVAESKVCSELIKKYEGRVSKGKIDPDKNTKDVIVFCGIRRSSKHYAYIMAEKRWVRLPFMEQKHTHGFRSGYASAVINNELYLVQEEDGYKAGARLLKLNQKKHCWDRVSLDKVNEAFSQIHLYQHKLVVSCAGYICMIGYVGQRHQWDGSDSRVFIRMFPTRPDLSYKYIFVDHIPEKDSFLDNLCACAVQDKVIFLLANNFSRLGEHKVTPVCVCYNVVTGETVNCSDGAQFGPLVYSDTQGKVYVHSFGGRRSAVFTLATRKWRTSRYTVPCPKDSHFRSSAMSCVYDMDIHAFSAAKRVAPSTGSLSSVPPPRQPMKFCFRKRHWEDIPQSPMEFSDSSIPVVITLPSSLLTCPPQCPHCEACQPYIPVKDSDQLWEEEDDWSGDESDDEYFEDFYHDSDYMDDYNSDNGSNNDCCIQ